MNLSGKSTAPQSGAGMIEVLVAITIVAFAMFALIDMQTAALRYQKTAHLRATASQYSADLADRVRANIRGAHAGAYNLLQQTYPALEDQAPSCFDPAACTAQELAARDIHEWRAGLGRSLAGGWGEILGSVARGFTIRVYFRDAHTQGKGATPVVEHCQPTAADLSVYRDVRCLSTVFFP